MTNPAPRNEPSGPRSMEDRKTSTFLFKWTEKASEVSVTVWETGLDNRGRQVKLRGNEYWDGFSYQKLEELENHHDKVYYKFKVDGVWTVNPDYNQEEGWMRGTTTRTMYNVITHKELQSVAGLWRSMGSKPSTTATPGPRYPPPLTGRSSSQNSHVPNSANVPPPEPMTQGSARWSKVPTRATVQETIFSDTYSTPKRGKVLDHRLPRGDQEIFIMSGDEVLILDDRDEWWYVECPGSGEKGLVPKRYVRIIDETSRTLNLSTSGQSTKPPTHDTPVRRSPPNASPAAAENTSRQSNLTTPHEPNNLDTDEESGVAQAIDAHATTSSNLFESTMATPVKLTRSTNEARAREAKITEERDRLAKRVKELESHVATLRFRELRLARPPVNAASQVKEVTAHENTVLLGGLRFARPPENGAAIPAAPSKTFSYKKLNFDDYEIRLLKLTWDHTDDSSLRSSVEHVSLIDPPSYMALSYCWGDPMVTETITLDDIKVDVTVSLASALKAIRNRYLLTGNGMRIWADALCIDQGNNEERSHQVRSMRQIYSKASQVVCWVGPNEAPGFSKAVDFWLADDHRRNYDNDADDAEKVEAFTTFEYDSWMLLNQLFSQPYWQRVWVIQEITVASKATVFFGDFHMPWDVVAQLLRRLQSESSLPGRPSDRAFLNAVHLLEFRDRFVNKRLDLMDALQMTRRALATDPRDKIFALLGLCHDGPLFVPIPNYKQSLETILADMTKAMMSMNRTLDLMCIRGTGPPRIDKTTLPTWSPDWPNVWAGPMTVQEVDFPHWTQNYDFNPILEGSNHREIKVQGRFIGKISRLTSGISSDGKIDAPTARTPWIAATSSLNQHNDRLRNPTQSELELRDFLWGTLTMSSLPTEETRSCFSTLWKPEGRGLVHNLALISWVDENAWFKVGPWTLREWSQVTSRHIVRNDQPGIILQIHRRVSWETTPKANLDDLLAFIGTLDKIIASGMKLAVLRGDQPLGMVHPHAMEQDEIYLLHGCTLPVVLRPKEHKDGRKHYHVIGAAYTLGTDPSSTYYLGTRDKVDLLDWKGKNTQVLTLT